MNHSTNNEKFSRFLFSFFGKRSWVFIFLLCFCFINAQISDKSNTLSITIGANVYASDSVSVTKTEKPKIYIAGNAKVYGLHNVEKVKIEPVSENIKNNPPKALAKVTEEKTEIHKQNAVPKTATIKNKVEFSTLPAEHFTNYSVSKSSCIAPPANQQVKYHFADNNVYHNLNHLIYYYKERTRNDNHFSILQQGFKKNYRCRPPPVV